MSKSHCYGSTGLQLQLHRQLQLNYAAIHLCNATLHHNHTHTHTHSHAHAHAHTTLRYTTLHYNTLVTYHYSYSYNYNYNYNCNYTPVHCAALHDTKAATTTTPQYAASTALHFATFHIHSRIHIHIHLPYTTLRYTRLHDSYSYNYNCATVRYVYYSTLH